MSTEIWMRNPHNYIREIAEVGGDARIAWDRGLLIKKQIEPVVHAKVYFGAAGKFRILVVGPQGTAELDANHTMANPVAVYPTWEYGEDIAILEDMMSENIGDDPLACMADVPIDERPVLGQEHRVIVTNLPAATNNAHRAFYRMLKTLQEDYPDTILHVHGSYSYRIIFGLGFRSGDFEARTDAAMGKVVLPMGKKVTYAHAVGFLQWVNMLGFSVPDLKEPRNRCIFNIKSALWASEHWNENLTFKSRGPVEVDPNSPSQGMPTSVAASSKVSLSPKIGDKVICNECSLASSCKYYRTGAVCSLPGAETNTLVTMFKSRDSDQIIDALGALQGAAVGRLQRGMEAEEAFGELDPEVTKLINQVFGQGEKLAKLVNPNLMKPGVQINIGKDGATTGGSTTQQVVAQIVREFEAKGIDRSDITPQMMQAAIEKMSGVSQGQIVQGEVS